MREIEMKGKTSSLLVGCLVVLSLIIIACSSPASVEPDPELTDEQLELLKQELTERGSCNVDTLEAASRIAGFPVATPAYLPEDFYRGSNIMVTQLGDVLPEGMKPKFTASIVQMFYYCQGNDSVMFMLQQTQHKTGLGGGEPTEICGRQGERSVEEANPRRKFPSPMLTFAWEDDGIYYMFSGFLSGPLDEKTLEKIACSIGTD